MGTGPSSAAVIVHSQSLTAILTTGRPLTKQQGVYAPSRSGAGTQMYSWCLQAALGASAPHFERSCKLLLKSSLNTVQKILSHFFQMVGFSGVCLFSPSPPSHSGARTQE